MRGLLDLTDNVDGAETKRPPRVVDYDDADPYFVVAPDKGAAGLSDRANEIALEYGFWLGDSFATGGSHGFHHKRLGITARGAFVCVRQHFRELGVDLDVEPFTVVGVGGMAGDVFGNGMLLSSNIRLLAAFDADHIFLDPAPDRQTSFAERKLFETPGATWEDYSRALISPGGGVIRRAAKDIPLSAGALEGKMTADRRYELLLRLEDALAFLCRWAWEHGRRLTPSPDVIGKWRGDLLEYLDYLGESPEFALLSTAAPEASRLLFLDRLRDFPIVVDLVRESGENLSAVANFSRIFLRCWDCAKWRRSPPMSKREIPGSVGCKPLSTISSVPTPGVSFVWRCKQNSATPPSSFANFPWMRDSPDSSVCASNWPRRLRSRLRPSPRSRANWSR